MKKVGILKGTKKVERIMNRFLNEFDCHAQLGEDFAYYYNTNTITYSFYTDSDSTEEYQKFIAKNFPYVTCNIFLWSLLHEVGHHETINRWDDDQQDFFDKEKEEIEEEMGQGHDRELYQRYFNVPDEYAASEWAAEYLEENEEKIRLFWEELQDAIMNFYRINCVELLGEKVA